jgi:hypothetical protein
MAEVYVTSGRNPPPAAPMTNYSSTIMPSSAVS